MSREISNNFSYIYSEPQHPRGCCGFPVGRFAPSPTGRMHLGNVFAALMSWLSAKSRGGRWILRIEDLDPQRSKESWAHLIEDDLRWLGLHPDEGGYDASGPSAPYRQSLRSEFYEKILSRLNDTGLTYPCRCTRADILSTQAPHESDGRIVYPGTCRPRTSPDSQLTTNDSRLTTNDSRPVRATRLIVPDETITFTDRLYGRQSVNLASHCGDFVLRRADGAWAYQLAVVADDAAMGVNEVVRGSDLLLSSAQQIYLYRLLGLEPPEFAHIPLLCNEAGQRLSKRDRSMNMEELRDRFKPEDIIGYLAHIAGQTPSPEPISAEELLAIYNHDKIPRTEKLLCVSANFC